VETFTLPYLTSCTSKEEAPAEGRPNMKTRRKPVLAPIGVVARRQLRPPVCAPFFQDSAPPPSPWPRGRYIVIAEKTGLCRQIEGPYSSYCCRVCTTLWNSGVEASIEPPNLLTRLPL